MSLLLHSNAIARQIATLFFVFAFSFCASAQNVIVAENALTGNPSSEWDINGAGDLSIQGFATDISVNKGQDVHFKIDVTDAAPFTIKIYRLGYYQGNGARLIADLGSYNGIAQPQPLSDSSTGLIDCGNWSKSASWTIPQTAVSGVYIAKLTKATDQGSSHIMFIVRDDQSTADLYFQTSDATWQAYNVYGGNSLYVGVAPFANGHAAKVSYNRPFITRNGGGGGGVAEDGPFNAEYPMIRWLEKNGYDVTYTTNVDADRNGGLLLKHKAFLSVGHDEYWSAQQRANVEAARNAGVHLAFFSGNEVYWKTRWENSIDGSNTPHRTLVCYKEGTLGENICGGKCDPLENTWTGLWRDGCSFTGADGCKPENALTGQISWDQAQAAITVPDTYKNLRFWRNTSIATLADGQSATLTQGTIGYEYSYERPEYASHNPAGRMLLSSTIINGHNHKLSLYRHASGAWVFGAGTVQWSWGLDENHDRGNDPPSTDMQQATVNLLADMMAQPASLQSGLVAATASNDSTAPSSIITSPANGTAVPNGTITVSGTASDDNTIAGVEVSVDGGTTWMAANGTSTWNFSWTPTSEGNAVIKSRAVDDNGNIEAAGIASSVNAVQVSVAPAVCPCSIFQPASTPDNVNGNDGQAIEIGVRFKPAVDGYITGIRFYKATGDNGTHIGHLWTNEGTSLSFATFSGESASGWQQVSFASPVAVTANTTYVASYFSSENYYSSSDNFFTSPAVNGPLTALADGDDGPNGVYVYTGSPAFPSDTYNRSNYWVDVVFEPTVGADSIPPAITSTFPANKATGVKINATISLVFNEAIDTTTINNNTIELRNGLTLVNTSVSYNAGTRTATITPLSPLVYSSAYTITVKGGLTDPRIKDTAGNALVTDSVWTFTTASPAPPSPTEGPGGPILVISAASNPFSRYAVEILRAEGLNEFNAMDISAVNAATLNNYDVAILGEMPLSAANVSMLTDWVTTGKTLITFRPDGQLSDLLGITSAGGSLSDKYLLVNTASGPGTGIVGETIQFHGAADQYTLNGATSLATLYSDANSATAFPAITLNNKGANGGKAVAFTYDLARSIVYTRQGNPAWAGQKRDGQSGPVRSDDMFFPDWVDFNKIAIPQADEQQHLLTNIISQSNLHNKPLPRFWFLPRKLKAAVVMTGDDHGNNGTTGRFNQYLSLSSSNTPQAVADWTAIRGTSYIYPGTPITNAQAHAFEEQGFEISLHLNTGCANYTQSSLENDFATQLAQLASQLPGILPPTTHRTHCIAWSDWATKPKVELALGIRLNTDYYYWPGAWIKDRPGMFTGSGMPMRYAGLDGTIIDNYQVTTQMTDESEISYSKHATQLLDKAIGTEGYYGVFCANMHTDVNGGNSTNGSDAIIAAAKARQIPVISARQMLTWLDGRNGSYFSSMTWSGNTLNFAISVAAGAHQLQAMVPVTSAVGQLSAITLDSIPVSYTMEIIKGVNYAFFDANTGSYAALYTEDNTPPVISNISAIPNTNGTATITWTTDELSTSKVNYGSAADSLNLNNSDNAFVTNHSITLSSLTAGATYYFNVTSTDVANNSSSSPDSTATPLVFSIPDVCANDQVLSDFNKGTADNTIVVSDADGEVILRPTLNQEFEGTAIPSGWTEGVFSSGGTTVVANGSVTVNGTHIATNNNFAPGSSIEFIATFNSASFQNVGFSADQPFDNAPWITIGQGANPDGNLYARASDGSSISLGNNLLGSSHRYFIKWNTTAFLFYVDGDSIPAATINFTVNQNLYLQISDVLSNDGTLSVNMMRVTPYQSSGSYTSRIFDHGALTSWGILTWSQNKPAGTGLSVLVRTGNTAVPDSSWSDFAAVDNGDTIGSNSRYLQYRADLSTTDSAFTPALQAVSITCSEGADDIAPVISSVVATPSGDGSSVTITWITNENATSSVDYGTSTDSLSQSVSGTTPQTAHSLLLTGLTPATTYYFRITAADEAGNSTTLPDTLLSPFSFTTSVPVCFDDITLSDFAAGTTGPSTYVVPDNDGEVILKPFIAEEFSVSEFPASLQSGSWHSAGSTTISNGSLLVNGERAATMATFAPGTSIEFVATFSADPFQNIGFAADFDFNSPWFAIGTGGSGDGVYARADGQGDISLGSGLIGTSHRYRIDWNTNDIVFFVDGVQKATMNISISNNLLVIISDYEDSENPTAINVDWLRVKPYASSGSFVSRVYDGGAVKNWISASWNADIPAGTTLQIFERHGKTAVPDATWTAYKPILAPGDSVGGASRYIQYRADFTTTDNALTPVLKDFAITCTPNKPPTVKIISPVDDTTYLTPATIIIIADAFDVDGTIKTVEFYSGTTLLNTERYHPYRWYWKDVPPGHYIITAKATDNSGLVTVSAPVHVSVALNKAPTVSIINPADNQTYAAPAAIHLEAAAKDPDGLVKTVEFFNGDVLLATEHELPYTYDWKDVPVGDYVITAKATDNSGTVTTSAILNVSVVANKAPSVSIINPANEENFISPATVNLQAIARDPDGTISEVAFYSGTTLLTTERLLPYTFQWRKVPAGSYTITAIATDNQGLQTTSLPVSITVSQPGNLMLSNKISFIKNQAGTNGITTLKLAPNPAHSVLNVYTNGLQKNKQVTVSIISASGVILKTKVSMGFAQVTQLDVLSLVSGVYTIAVIYDDKVMYKQFVKL